MTFKIIKGAKYYITKPKKEKYSGWYYCHARKAFFRWTEFIEGQKNND